jgi:dipeptidyl aminopeptidase/acylaminoacyl peptidase
VVQIDGSQKMVDALKAIGSNVKFTVYPRAGHDSWTATYRNPELYKWFLAHSR